MRLTNATSERSEGERERLQHALTRARATLNSLETALTLPGPIGHETAQALVTSALELAMLIARHDAFSQVESSRQ